MPKTTFAYDTIVPPEWFNAIQNFAFVANPQNDGEYPLIPNTALSNAPGQIKPEWEGFRDAFRVSAGAGLNINYVGGVVTLETGLTQTIAPGSLSLAANSTNYVFINAAGAVVTSTVLPARWCPIAAVVTTASAISSISDLRERFRIAPIARAIPAFGSAGYEGDLTIASNTTLSGSTVRFVRNFTVNAGATLTVTGGLFYVKASGTVTINGGIIINPVAAAGGGFSGSVGAGFLFIGEPGSGNGRAPGHNLPPNPSYPYSLYTVSSSGGTSGLVRVGLAGGVDVGTARGGLGGGALFIEAAGAVTIGGAITADGGAATAATLANPLGGTDALATGACGGTGGVIWIGSLSSIVASAAATCTARGGASSAGARVNSVIGVSGAGGSSGGWLVFQAPSVSINAGATLNVSGGAGGPGISSGSGFIGSVSGASFAGSGGAIGANGTTGATGGTGQIIQQNFAPI